MSEPIMPRGREEEQVLIRQFAADRLRLRMEAAAEQGLYSFNISKSLAANLLHALTDQPAPCDRSGEPVEEKIARLTRERDEMAAQAGACAEEVDRIRVEIGTVQAENSRLSSALADSERKRVEAVAAEREACAAICDARAKYFDQAPEAAGSYRATAKEIRRRTSTPTPQETARVED